MKGPSKGTEAGAAGDQRQMLSDAWCVALSSNRGQRQSTFPFVLEIQVTWPYSVTVVRFSRAVRSVLGFSFCFGKIANKKSFDSSHSELGSSVSRAVAGCFAQSKWNVHPRQNSKVKVLGHKADDG